MLMIEVLFTTEANEKDLLGEVGSSLISVIDT